MPRKLEKVSDPIPNEGLLLADAFSHVVEAVDQNRECVREEYEFWKEVLWRNLQSYEEFAWQSGLTGQLAAIVLRGGLSEDLNSYVRDPVYDRILKLDSGGWCPRWIPPHPDAKIYLFENWIDPVLMPGPSGTDIAGKRRPIFVLKSEFAIWLAHQFGKKDGNALFRPGSYDKSDAPVVLKMRAAIEAGECKSARDAALKYVSMASGSGTVESKGTRLIRAYYKAYPK